MVYLVYEHISVLLSVQCYKTQSSSSARYTTAELCIYKRKTVTVNSILIQLNKLDELWLGCLLLPNSALWSLPISLNH